MDWFLYDNGPRHKRVKWVGWSRGVVERICGMFGRVLYASETLSSLENLDISLCMAFTRYNPMKSDLFFKSYIYPMFLGSLFFRVHVIQEPGFSGSRYFKTQGFQGLQCH